VRLLRDSREKRNDRQINAGIGFRMNFSKGTLGWIEVICGPMFSGKSEELIRRLRRAEIARQRVQIFKPGIDQRYSEDHIVSHSELKIRSECVRDAAEIEKRLDVRTEVIGIDEAQFLGMELVEIVIRLADMGKRVIIAGLDTDYLGRPFHPMPELLAVADEITKDLAICMRCGNPAKHTQRLVASDELVVVGAAGMYEARCRRCFEPNPANLKSERKVFTPAAAAAPAKS
jgi:thymidine kinase